MREIGNPFAENKIPSVSMFSKERPRSTRTDSKEILEGLEKVYSVKEYLGVKMNYETRAFFEKLVAQIGEGAAEALIANKKATFDDSGDLTFINCNDTSITSLPELPKNLDALYCDDTLITSLPELPKGLKVLYCSNTQITSLPELPHGLIKLSCSNTSLAKLPTLPESLEELDCANTQIYSLPELPNALWLFYCQNTPLSEDSEVINELREVHPNLQIFDYEI